MPPERNPRDLKARQRMWNQSICRVIKAAPSLDYIGWHGKFFAIVRRTRNSHSGRNFDGDAIETHQLSSWKRMNVGTGKDFGDNDVTWLERRDVPMHYDLSLDE
jgi:hypothetical protein